MSSEELYRWLNSERAPPALLDIRKEAETDVSSIAGSTRVDPKADDKDLLEVNAIVRRQKR
jgi:rhodanese-related sulfurtransferase